MEGIAQYVYPLLYQENTELKERNKELESQLEKHKKYQVTCADQAVELHEYKSKLREAQARIRELEAEKGKPQGSNRKYLYDIMDWGEGTNGDDLDYLFDLLVNIVNEKTLNGDYLVDSAMVLAPIFKLLTESEKIVNTKWEYKGTLVSLCEYWNKNIVPYVEDETRRDSLLCSYDDIKAEVNKNPWKNSNPLSWKKLYIGSKRKAILRRALNIKDRMEKNLK